MTPKNNRKNYLIILVLFVTNLFIWNAILFWGASNDLELYFLDVGQGDGQLISLPGNVQILIDGGPGIKTLSEVNKALGPTDRYIDLVILSHPQLDHFGGFIDVFKNYSVGAFIFNGQNGIALAYKDLIKAVEENGAQRVILGEGDKIRYKDYILEILAPSSSDLASKEANDGGLVVMLKALNLKVLYTADIDSKLEKKLISKYELKADVLKVGHHGSKYSSSKEFLVAVSPKVAVIEVGKNNYGHPTKAALSRLANTSSMIFRTDQDKTVKIISDGENLKIYKSRVP